jgi:peptidoglycan/xylan/chitin deacetylase (PgdA/CDA1 family)
MNKIFTTSWDDGHVLDKKIADLLKRCGIKGTFYIAQKGLQERLSDEEIKNLAQDFEVGAHTINHHELTTLTEEDAHEEIVDSKKWLENLLDKEVRSFCYPRGDFNQEVKETVRLAGFKLARTVKAFKLDFTDPFEMGTTLHVYPYPWRKKDSKHLKFRSGILGFQPNRFRQAVDFGVPIFKNFSWFSLAKSMFDIFLQKGGVFHLWGHSWEIEKYGLWPDLERFLKYVSENKNFLIFATNNEVLTLNNQNENSFSN